MFGPCLDSRFRGNERDQRNSPSRSVTLHAARIGGGAAARSDPRRRGEPAFRPIRSRLDTVAGARGARPERAREMFGMPGRRVDRLLQVHAAMHVTQEHLRDPLILTIAAWRAPGEIRLAVA